VVTCDLTAGDLVHDTEDQTPDDAVVVNTPPVAAEDWEAPGLDGTTVADDNPDYPADAPVAIIVYKHHLAEYDPDWLAQEDPDPIPVSQLREDRILTYSFPAPRLTLIERSSTDGADTADASARDGNGDDGVASPDTEAKQDAQAATGSNNTPDDETVDDSDPADDESPPEPSSPAVQALKDRLEDGGMTVEVEADGNTLRAEKLGEQYRVQPGQIVEGDGALRGRLESIVSQFGDEQSGSEPEPKA
jgi:hypothetical protein